LHDGFFGTRARGNPAIRSDLPGQITAQVTENVYDSPTGGILLVPQGTRIIGQCDNGVGLG
jgi:type IV secretion system protein VirB10